MISVLNRQRRVRLQIHWLREAAAFALPSCGELSDDGRFALRELAEITIAVVSDARISRIHQEFMGIAGPTDVITFEHGDIVVSAETAHANAPRYNHTIEEELLLYTIHGLLHLNGFDDQTTLAAARMRRAQTRIWREVLAAITPPSSPCSSPNSPSTSPLPSPRPSRPPKPNRMRRLRT